MNSIQDEDEETTGSEDTEGDTGGDVAEAEPSSDASEGESDDSAPQETAPAAPAAAPSAEDIKQQAIKDYIAKQYGQASDNSGVQAAQASASHLNTVANIGSALEGLARSNSMAHGGAGVDASFYQGIKSQGQQGVQQAQQAREQKIKDYITKLQLGREGVQDQQTARDNKVKNDANDPNSQQSQVARHVWEKANPDMDLAKTPGWANMSANDVSLVKDPIDLKARLDQKALAASELAEARRQHNDYMAGGAAGKAAAAQTKADAKASADQGKAFTEMTGKINGGRGTPQNVGQAMIAQTSVQKAKELLDQAPGGDLNKLTPQQVNLLNAEIEKIATGGVPTEAGRAGLDPGTFQARWEQFKNKAVGPDGQVNGAQLAPFIQQNKAYLEGLGKVTSDVIHKYQRDTFDDYADSGRLSSDHQDKFKKRHPELFPEEQVAGTPGTAAHPSAHGAPAAPGPTPAATHPQAGDAVAWAKAHPNDPRAAEILKRTGPLNAGL